MKFIIVFFLSFVSVLVNAQSVKIGSKTFSESYLVAEIVSQYLEANGISVDRHFEIGATGLLIQALNSKSIDLYPEYTGTILSAVLKTEERLSFEDLQSKLNNIGFVLTSSLGFSNSYGLAIRDLPSYSQLKSISEMSKNTSLRAGFSNEFMNRLDGYPGLKKAYNLHFADVKELSHALAYEALERNQVDVVDVYTTDPQIASMKLKVLNDNMQYFPPYEAVLLARKELSTDRKEVWELLKTLEGKINLEQIQTMNLKIGLQNENYKKVASDLLQDSNLIQAGTQSFKSSKYSDFVKHSIEHLLMVLAAVMVAIIIGIPLAIYGRSSLVVGEFIILMSTVMQTIPSLALLCLLIPIFGIGKTPASVALFLYALLPIVVSTFDGLRNIDSTLLEVADSMGFTKSQRLKNIELPLIKPQILSGVQIATVQTVGTATLAAMIGAGGLGTYIVTGLTLNNMNLILKGAIPTAVLAIGFDLIFKWFKRRQ